MAWFSRLIITILLCYVPFGAMAQQPAPAPTQSLLKPAELDQLLAPIALHPEPKRCLGVELCQVFERLERFLSRLPVRVFVNVTPLARSVRPSQQSETLD